MKKRILSLALAMVMVSALIPSLPLLSALADDEYIYFPDPNFRAAVNSHFYFNPPRDTITEREAARLNALVINDNNITDLTGIEYFTEIESLSCTGNQITAMDLSKNTKLKTLDCSGNNLTALDLSQNTALEVIWCNNNQLTSINLGEKTVLEEFQCNGNQLTALDVSKAPALKTFWCGENRLAALDVSKNVFLEKLGCGGNLLTVLDVSKNPLLTEIGGGVNSDHDSLDFELIIGNMNGHRYLDKDRDRYLYEYNLSVQNLASTDKATLDYYRQPSYRIESDDKDIIALANSIVKDISGDFNKVRAIHDWVAENIWYDYDILDSDVIESKTALKTLQDKRGICDDYASLTAALMRAAGFPAKYTLGYIRGSSYDARRYFNIDTEEYDITMSHAWNQVYIDDRWVILDTTWDSQNSYSNGQYHEQNACKQEYFDMSAEDMLKHRPFFRPDPTATEVRLPKGVTTIQQLAYYENREVLQGKLTIPDGVVTIEAGAFSRCEYVTELILPDSLLVIGPSVFYGGENLRSVTIPPSVVNIHSGAFQNCPNLTVYGAAGSAAEQFAAENRLKFVAGIPPSPIETADTWAHGHINEANDKGFVPPSLQNNYKANITRGEFVTLAMSWLNYQTGKTNDQLTAEFAKFPDRAFTDTTDTVILAAARLDITAGVGNDQFGVDGTFNRQQAAVMLTKVFAILGQEVGAEKDFGFTDLDTADGWAQNAINFVGGNEIMSGKGGGRFAPHDTFQRQESIIVFNKMG